MREDRNFVETLRIPNVNMVSWLDLSGNRYIFCYLLFYVPAKTIIVFGSSKCYTTAGAVDSLLSFSAPYLHKLPLIEKIDRNCR